MCHESCAEFVVKAFEDIFDSLPLLALGSQNLKKWKFCREHSKKNHLYSINNRFLIMCGQNEG